MITASLFEPAWVWLQRGALDREIARGADLTQAPRLARRAKQLASRRCRRGIAQGLRNLLDAAEHPDRALTSAVPVQRHEILRESGFILQIAIDLEGDEPVNARGVDALTHAHAALHLA